MLIHSFLHRNNRRHHGQKSRKPNLRYERLECRWLFALDAVPTASGDFNGDGIDDVAMGIPCEDVGAVVDAGGVNVIYGTNTGLSAIAAPVADQFWTQDSLNIEDQAEPMDNFGSALAAGDFNGDGFDDLAIGIPGEDIGLTDRAGAVAVIYGSANGLSATAAVPDEFWHQNSANILGSIGMADLFGAALASGDFDNDGFADLAIGVPNEGVNGDSAAGAVNVIYGLSNASGLSHEGNQLWHQDVANIDGSADPGDRFGGSLATGDFDGDGRDDLAIGVEDENVGALIDAGAVNVIYGQSNLEGLQATDDQLWTQDSPGILDSSEAYDAFGRAVVAGDFNGDGRDDLAIGVPGEDVGTGAAAGAVNVIYGRSAVTGLTSTSNQFWHQNSFGIPDVAQSGDLFGHSLTAGDFNNDGKDDLAVGVPGENDDSFGAVNVIYGRYNYSGLDSLNAQLWHQDTAGMLGTRDSSENFGTSVTAGDFNGDGLSDLVIGIPFEKGVIAGAVRAIQVVYGFNALVGLSAANNQIWHQNSLGVNDSAESSDMCVHIPG